MKFHWGNGIALFYILFALSMVGAVFAAQRHKPGLVQARYYDLDLNYQEHLEKKQHAAALPQAPSVQFDAAAQVLRVQIPDAARPHGGTARCFRSDLSAADLSLPLNDAGSLSIPAEKLRGGRWHIELDWADGHGEKYFWESTFHIPTAL